MGHPSVDFVDLASTLEGALAGSLGLDRAAEELGAVAFAVLLTEGPQIEVTYFRSHSGSTDDRKIPDGLQNFARAIDTPSGPVDAGNALAGVLGDWISPAAHSFLLFTWRVQRRIVTTVFGFSEQVVPHRTVPDFLAERLSLIGLATWSVREIARLRAELKAVNSRLARRKLVERAKGILQTQRGLSEEQAYAYLRGSSRRRRIPLTELAEEVLRARTSGSLTLNKE